MEKSNVLVNFGCKVREKRKFIGLSQEELADLAGVHRTYVGMIERGEKNLSLLNIYKIARALNVDVGDLF